MALKPRYFEYLNHFQRTTTVAEMAAKPEAMDLIALRHDIDYDLDIALEMAFHEWKRGFRATYYLLPTADYWRKDPDFIEKCLQLQDFGHEIGLHLNILVQWIKGETDDPAATLAEQIQRLRQRGVQITGVSTHGDSYCYQANLINHWIFAELRPDDPLSEETGKSAEGIPEPGVDKVIRYPASHDIQRDSGERLPLWSVSMRELGLAYDAVRVPFDAYYTDSGGKWGRSADPLACDLRQGRHQVLIHPIHWREPNNRMLFVLSTARSGSKWLSTVMEQASSTTARHEFTLNHRYDAKAETLSPEKRTGAGFVPLLQDKDELRRLALESRTWVETLKQDYAECNVYLAHLPEILEEVFPEASWIHLHRDPREVVRSLMNRDWYDTPDDDRHPIMAVPGWETLSQFEKACWYVRKTNEALAQRCQRQLRFERMTRDMDYLSNALCDAGLALYPRLAEPIFQEPINANRHHAFPAYAQWDAETRKTFHRICDPVNRLLGYPVAQGALPRPALNRLAYKILNPLRENTVRLLNSRPLCRAQGQRLVPLLHRLYNCKAEPNTNGLMVTAGTEEKVSYCTFAPKFTHSRTWVPIIRNRRQKWYGWQVRLGCYYQGSVEVEAVEPGAVFQLICRQFDEAGNVVLRRPLVKKPVVGKAILSFSFRPRAFAHHFDLQIIPDEACAISVRALSLAQVFAK